LPEKDWVSVSLPEHLVKEIDHIMDEVHRWTSRAEFVREAVRRSLDTFRSDRTEGT